MKLQALATEHRVQKSVGMRRRRKRRPEREVAPTSWDDTKAKIRIYNKVVKYSP
jgi:hypothetical protein